MWLLGLIAAMVGLPKMDGLDGKVRFFSQNEPIGDCLGPYVEESPQPSQERVGRRHHETSDCYLQVVVQLSNGWRIILCKRGIQWILQRHDAERSGQRRWKAVGYFRTKKALVRVSRTLCQRIEPHEEAILNALPERVD